MNDLRQAAQQALEALALELHGKQYPHMVKGYCLDAITAVREALAQPQQQAEPVHGDIRALKYRIHELEGEVIGYKRMLDVAEAASQPQQQAEPVSHAVIAGALFDFMGWLTTRKERLVLSSTDNASPAADSIKHFAEMRGLLLDDARVQVWQDYTAPPQRKPLTDEQIIDAMHEDGCERIENFYVVGPVQKAAVFSFARAVEAKIKEGT